MVSLRYVLAGAASMATSVFAQDEPVEDMGPAAFMWPEDRVWSGDADNTAPCGSVAAPRNRTEFPMQSGQVALVAQDDSYDVTLSISYSNDPQSNDDFETLINARAMRELDPGHTCVDVTDAPSSVEAGDYATLQIRYTAQFDNPDNETFYACADIVWIEVAHFTGTIPCFNATDPEAGDPDWYHDGDYGNPDDNDDADDNDDPPSTGSDAPEDNSNSDANSDSGSGSSSGSGLSGGAIAGIVVGSVAGVALIIAAGMFIYRRKQQRLRALRQEHSSRGVNWEAQPGKTVSTDSVRMENLS